MQDNSVAAAAGADAGGGSSSMMMLPPQFIQNPVGYLSEVASMRPSSNGLSALAGPVSQWFSNPPSDVSSDQLGQIASVYLQAASGQLKDVDVKVGDVEQEMTRTKQKYQIMDAVGVAASRAPRMGISSSEILPTLGTIMLNKPNELQQASVEFLQCALLAEQYRYAERLIRGTWPRPNSTVSVKQVLRYYYLRGMIYLGCDDAIMAHRCFWTCLSVPAESNSKIMLEAWKKVVLVQLLLEDSMTVKQTRLPRVMPNVLSRLLASYKENKKAKGSLKQEGEMTGDDQVFSSLHPQQQPQQEQKPDELEASVGCYMDLASAFCKRDKTQFETLQQQHGTILRADGNTGLVVQVHSRLIRNMIYHTTNVYAAIPIPKLSETLKIPESEIPSALRQSQIVCEIQDNTMVVFGDQPKPPISSVEVSEWMQLLDTVQKLDVSIATNSKYHALVKKDGVESSSAEKAQGPRGVEEF